MAHFICDQCGGGFVRSTRSDYRVRFCGQPCYQRWRVGKMPPGGFAKGTKPWNRNLKGIHLSPATEFKPGPRPELRDPIGTVRIRKRHNRPDKPRAWVKVAHPNVWRLRAIVVWENANGPVPDGCVVHHMDRDTLRDDITNLAVLSRAAHLAEHRREHDSDKRSASLREGWKRRRSHQSPGEVPEKERP